MFFFSSHLCVFIHEYQTIHSALANEKVSSFYCIVTYELRDRLHVAEMNVDGFWLNVT